jgi:AraC-like DNA-binding protein
MGGMIVESYAPPPPLSFFVAQFWHYANYVLGHDWERIMPSCGTALLINLQDDELRWRHLGGNVNCIRGIGICGPQPEPIEIDTLQQRFIMGIEFREAGAAALLGIPGHEIAATHVGLDDLYGREASLLHERLVEARSAAERFRILDNWLMPQAVARGRPHLAVVHALSLLERMPVAAVVSQLAVSPKQLIRSFRDHVGLTPKLYCRVARFERLLKAIEQSPDVNWALVGAHHGYYDQAHLAHEFRSLSGYSPTEYLALRGPYARHVPVTV